MKTTINPCLAALTMLALLGAAPVMAAWQADQPAAKDMQKAGASSSPFALPEKGQAQSAPAGGNQSPFSLPSTAPSQDKPQAPAQGQSPFALPEKEPSGKRSDRKK